MYLSDNKKNNLMIITEEYSIAIISLYNSGLGHTNGCGHGHGGWNGFGNGAGDPHDGTGYGHGANPPEFQNQTNLYNFLHLLFYLYFLHLKSK